MRYKEFAEQVKNSLGSIVDTIALLFFIIIVSFTKIKYHSVINFSENIISYYYSSVIALSLLIFVSGMQSNVPIAPAPPSKL